MSFVFNPGNDGFGTVFKDYQEMSLRFVWGSGERGVVSRDVWVNVNKEFGGSKTISRASIINFLNAACGEGIIDYREETTKGGIRRRYFPGVGEEGLKKHLATKFVSKLLEIWPEAAREAAETLLL